MISRIDEIIQGMQVTNLPSNYWINSNIEFPELEVSKLVMQRNDQSVWEHTMHVIDLLAIKNSVTLLSGLFHDLGKNCNQSKDDLKFPYHPIESANIAKIRLTEWGASSYLTDRVIRIILTHMYDIVIAIKEKTAQKFIADVGQDNIENWFILRKADSMAYSRRGRYKRHLIDPFYRKIKDYLEKLPPKNDPTQLQSEPNIVVEGKEHKSGNAFLSTEGG